MKTRMLAGLGCRRDRGRAGDACDRGRHNGRTSAEPVLRVWIDGKTGGRWLIAKHKAIDALKRLHKRQVGVKDIGFDELFKKKGRT